MQDHLTNWGFDPTGTALGGQSSPSMPTEPDLGVGNPEKEWQTKLDEFTTNVENKYGISGYRDHGFFRQDEIPVEAISNAIESGSPRRANIQRTNSNVSIGALVNPNSGLPVEKAIDLGSALERYDPSILEGLHIPSTKAIQKANKFGLVTHNNEVPSAFINPSTGRLYEGMAESLRGVIERGSPNLTYVDEMGVAHKYSKGTGPYDNPRRHIPGGLAGLGAMKKKPITGSRLAASPSLSLRAIGAKKAGTAAGGSTTTPEDDIDISLKQKKAKEEALAARRAADAEALRQRVAEREAIYQKELAKKKQALENERRRRQKEKEAQAAGMPVEEATETYIDPATGETITPETPVEDTTPSNGEPVIDYTIPQEDPSDYHMDYPQDISVYPQEGDDMEKRKFPWGIFMGMGIAALGVGIAMGNKKAKRKTRR